MTYEPTVWVDGPEGDTPIKAANLNKIEQTLVQLDADLATAGTVQSVNGETGAVVLDAAAVGAAATAHTHVPSSIGASALGHSHSPAEVGAAEAVHTHSLTSLGAAAAVHGHQATDITNSTPTGRSVLTAASAAAARTAIGAVGDADARLSDARPATDTSVAALVDAPGSATAASLGAAFAASDIPGFTGYHRGRSDKTASFTVTASDVGALTVVTSGSGTTATLPTPSALGVAVGQAVTIQQGGAGVVTLAPGAGCTLRNRAGSFVTGGQYAAVDAIAWSTSEWWVSGEVA